MKIYLKKSKNTHANLQKIQTTASTPKYTKPLTIIKISQSKSDAAFANAASRTPRDLSIFTRDLTSKPARPASGRRAIRAAAKRRRAGNDLFSRGAAGRGAGRRRRAQSHRRLVRARRFEWAKLRAAAAPLRSGAHLIRASGGASPASGFFVYFRKTCVA